MWLFALVVLVFFFRPLTTQTFYFRDLYHFIYPIKKQLADAGLPPLWDALRNGARPYLTTPTTVSLHPYNLVYLLLPTIFAFNAMIVVHVFFCAVAAYWLARVVGLPDGASFVAGAAFAFCGYTLSTGNLPLLLMALPWVPMTLGLTHRALRDHRSLAPAAIAAAMPFYCAAAELAGMLFITLVIWIAAARVNVSRKTKVIAGVIVIAFAVALSLAVILPATNVIAQSSRNAKRSYEAFSSWSLHPKRLPELIAPQYLGDTGSMDERRYHGHALESLGFPYILSVYFGVPMLMLAILGAFSRGREMPSGALALIAAAGLIFSLGRFLPFFRLLYEHVPLVGIFRYPMKVQMLTLLPLALLAAYGTEVLAQSRRARLAVLVAGLSIAIVAVIVAFSSGDEFVSRAFVHCAIASAAFAFASMRTALVPAVVLLDLLVAGWPVNRYAPRSLYEEPQLAAVVRNVAGDGRFWAGPRKIRVDAPSDDLMWLARWQMETLEGYTAAMYDIRLIFHDDYDGLAALRVARLTRVFDKLPWNLRRGLLDRAGVRAFMTPDVVPGFREIARMKTLRLYVNPTAPMARFVSSADIAQNERDALTRVVNARTLDRAVLEEQVPMDGCGSARVVHVAQNRYEVDAPCRGIVVLSEPHYDGWHARVNGREVAHVRADYAFTAIPVGKGRHVIERTYRPPLLVAGILASLAAAGLLVFVRRATS